MDIYKILETLSALENAPPAPGQQPQAQQQGSNTPQAQAAAKALQAGILKSKQQYPNLDAAFPASIIKEIRPDGTIVIYNGNSTGQITRLLALGGGANFKVIEDQPMANPAVQEGTMAAAAKHKSAKFEPSDFGGYWMGTDKNPPKPGQGVGGCGESVEHDQAETEKNLRYSRSRSPVADAMREQDILQRAKAVYNHKMRNASGPAERAEAREDYQDILKHFGAEDREFGLEEELRKQWSMFREYGANEPAGTGSSGGANRDGYYTYSLANQQEPNDQDGQEKVEEAGANNPGQGQMSQVDRATQQKQQQQTMRNVTTLKSAGVNFPMGATQTSQLATGIANDPNLTPQNMNPNQKKLAGTAGEEFTKDVLAKATGPQAQQIANIVKQIKTGKQQ
jgi:hypothetical protein